MLSLIRSAMSGEVLTADERALCTDEEITRAIELSTAHDLGQLVAWGLKKNDIPSAAGEKHIFTSVYRHQQIKYGEAYIHLRLPSSADKIRVRKAVQDL